MEAMLFVYFANILPQISLMMGLVIGGGLASLVVWLIFGGIFLMDYQKGFDWKTFKKPIWIIGIPVAIMISVKPLIPDRDTMYLMAGAYVGQKVLTSDIAKDAYEIIGLEVNKILQQKKKELQSSVEGAK